jgi:hypothetical protein
MLEVVGGAVQTGLAVAGLAKPGGGANVVATSKQYGRRVTRCQ